MAEQVWLVPGLMGSRLSAIYVPRWVETEIWLSYLKLAGPGWESLRLDATGTVNAVPGVPNLQPTGLLEAYYGTLVRWLRTQWDLRTWPYDWRKGVAWNGALLAFDIRNALSQYETLRFVCHSMGGLVFRSAWPYLTTAERAKITRVLFCAVPHQGAYGSVQLFSGVHETWQQLKKYLIPLRGQFGLFSGRDILDRVIGSCPGFYSLIPDPQSAVYPGCDSPSGAYQLNSYSQFNAYVSQTHLTATSAHWDAIRGVGPVPPVAVTVQGYGGHTPIGVSGWNDLTNPQEYLWDDLGDGTVAEAHSMWPNTKRFRLPAAHAAIPLAPPFIGAVNLLLREGLNVDFTADGPYFSGG